MGRPVKWLSFGNRKTKKHIENPEKANFEFRRISGVSNYARFDIKRGNSHIFVNTIISNMKTIIRTILR